MGLCLHLRVAITALFVGVGTFVQAAELTNPIRKSGPDPFIVYDNATAMYYLQVTTGSDLRIVSASTLGGLTNGNDKQVYQDSTMTSDATVWASELHKIDGTWYLYYSHGERPWVLTGGSSPLETYSNPVQLSDVFGIDGTVLTISSTNYFVWCCQSTPTGLSLASSICIAELTSPTSIDSDNIIVISQPIESWEQEYGLINEAPQALYWDNEVYLTYSANNCVSPHYNLGLLHFTGTNPLDKASWTKKTDGPVLSSGNGEYGTGHNGIFLSPDGTELWNVYHAVTNSAGSCGADRQTFVERIDTSNFESDGPVFGTPASQGSTAQGPSGEDGITVTATAGTSTSISITQTSSATSTSKTSSISASDISSSAITQSSSSAIVTSVSSSSKLSTSTINKASSASTTATSSATATAQTSHRGSHHTHSAGGAGNGGQVLVAIASTTTVDTTTSATDVISAPVSTATASAGVSTCNVKRNITKRRL